VYILDTNIISELMKPRHRSPSEAVLTWVNEQRIADLYITAINHAEILFGLQRLDDGSRKRSLIHRYLLMLQSEFSRRCLDFTSSTAEHYAVICADAEASGRRIPMADAMIASIAVEHNAVLVTRNIADFEGTGIDLLNPFIGSTGGGRR
jgi:predicted nucleic acid-binding protein